MPHNRYHFVYPTEALLQDDALPTQPPVYDHYAGAEKLMRKSLVLQQTLGPVFDITFDCEDGAAIGQEHAHAELAATPINSDDNRFSRIGVRIHGPNHDAWTQDADTLVGLTGRRFAYVTVSKVRDVVGVAHVTDRTNQAARAAGIARHLLIHVLIETHEALVQVFDIASLVQAECPSFGLVDFVSAHNGVIPGAAVGPPEQFEYPLIHRVLADIPTACHAYGKMPSYNVSTGIKHPDRAGADVIRACNEFDYLCKRSIHSDQIAPIVSAFRPSHEEVTHASAILASAQDTAWGPIRHEGRLYDRMSYRYWWAVPQRAHTTGVEMSPDAVVRFFA